MSSAATADLSDTDVPAPHDGTTTESPAVEVRGLYRGVVTNARVLASPSRQRPRSGAAPLLFAGAALGLGSLALFVVTAISVGTERRAYDLWQAAGKVPQDFVWKRRSAGLDLVVLGGLLAGAALTATGLLRRGKINPHFCVGSDAGVDAPIAAEFITWPAHPLVQAAAGDYLINVTPRMTGTVNDNGRIHSLADFTRRKGASFVLPRSGSTRLDCGATTFLITRTSPPRSLPVPLFAWNWNQQRFTVGAALALVLGIVMMSFVPSDPRSLSLDLLGTDARFVRFQIRPPEVIDEQVPTWLEHKTSGPQGGTAERQAGAEGQMGSKSARDRGRLYAIKGPKDNPDPRLAKTLAADTAANAGILGILKRVEGSHIASIFGAESALGSEAENVLGGLIGSQIGEAYGLHGMGVVGTGDRGGGTHDGLLGLGGLHTLGKNGETGNHSGYGGPGHGVGDLHARHAIPPDPMPGIVVGRGSLDKEIIRRVIRRHVNEVRYCYEQELTKNPRLGGRIVAQFTIAAEGRVISSMVQNSTMGNVTIENCTIQAIRRWEFPKPTGGGLVIVSYPFVLAPAGQ